MRCRLVIVMLLLNCSFAYAAPLIFYAEDQGPGWDETVRLATFPNSLAARSAFALACGMIGIEDLESFPAGSVGPLALDFDGNEAMLEGAGVVRALPAQTYAGTFPTSGSNYWLVDNPTAPFTVNFAAPVTAFGFYATDICDFWGTVSVNLSNGDTYLLGSNGQRISGGVMFLGIVDEFAPFTSVSFVPDALDHGFGPSVDGFGIDDMIVSVGGAIPAATTSWGAMKSLYR